MKLHYKAIHREELGQFLKDIGLLKELENGTLRCASCTKTLSPANIGTITKNQGNLVLLCDSSECVLPHGAENDKGRIDK